MAFSVQMPALGESVTEGTVTRWLKQEGDQVEVDEPLLEVSTDKVDTEIPSPAAGVLSRIVVAEDQTVEIGAELAVINGPGEGQADGGGGGQAQVAEPAEQRQPQWTEPEAQPAEDAAPPSTDQQATEPATEQATEPATQPTTEQATEPTPEPASERAEQPVEAPSTEQDQPAVQPTAGTGEGNGAGTPVTMPALGESVTEGTVTRWLKRVGDTVEVDEPLLEVSTDKVDTEIPSPVAGTLTEITVEEDQTVEVGAQLAMIGGGQPAAREQASPSQPAPSEPADARSDAAETAGAEPAQPAEQDQSHDGADDGPAAPRQAATVQAERPQQAPQQQQQPQAPAAQPQQQQAQAQPAAQGDGQAGAAPYVTPLVRKLAAEHDVNLAEIKGTGVGGRIRKQDVLAAAEAKARPAPQPEAAAPTTGGAPTPAAATSQPASSLRGRTEKMSRLRQVIAKRMVESLQTSAQLTTVLEVDVTRIARLRERAKRDFEAREGVKLSFLPFFAKAAVEALKQHPRLNASINSETNEVTYHSAEHLGMAVDTERGLLVPVIHDAGDLNIAGLARRIADLAERTRNNKVTPDELGGGTFTLTNTGSRGALFDTPIINQPQVAVLGTGAVVKRPVVVAGEDGDHIAIRSMMYLALSYDHRLIDGADAARFLTTLKERLEDGNFESDL